MRQEIRLFNSILAQCFLNTFLNGIHDNVTQFPIM